MERTALDGWSESIDEHPGYFVMKCPNAGLPSWSLLKELSGRTRSGQVCGELRRQVTPLFPTER